MTTEVAALKERARRGDLIALQQLRQTGYFAKKKAEQSGYPLSHAQKRLWLLQQMEGGAVAYNVPNAILMEGHLQPEALRCALVSVINRHEILRTTFAIIEGEPRQVIHDLSDLITGDFALEWVDLCQVLDPVAQARYLIAQDANVPFDLAQGPLFRLKLLRLAPTQHVLSINIHHIIFDAWSGRLLINELLMLYSAYCQGAARLDEADRPLLPPLSLQYKEYAAWQQKLLTSPQIAAARTYWHNKLGGELQPLALPTDTPRSALVTYEGAVVSITLAGGEMAQLDRLLRQQGATRYVGLVALVKTLLHRYTNQNDIVTGMAIAGRNDAALERQIGLYVNTLALRDVLSGEESWLALLDKVRQTCAEAMQHQIFPFDSLVDELKLRRDTSRLPIAEVMINLEHYEPSSSELTTLNIADFAIGVTPAKFDLTFHFAETGEAPTADVQLSLTYNRHLFSRERMERLTQHLRQLLQSVLSTPTQVINKLALLTPAETQQLLLDFNNTAATYPTEQTLVSLFERQVAETPNQPALLFAERVLTYQQLNQLANQVAWHLRQQHNLQPGEAVAILLERTEWMVVAMLAVLKAGGLYVPIDPTYPQDRIRHMLADAGCRVVLSEAAQQATLQPCLPSTFAAENVLEMQSIAERHQAEKPNLALPIAPDQSAYMLFTSGSTGKPKGCLISHRNVVRLLKNDRQLFDFNAQDVWVVAHSFCFDFSVWEMYGALLFGGSLVIAQREQVRDVTQFLALLQRYRVTVLNQTPAAFYNLIDHEGRQPAHTLHQHLRYVFFGGDRLEPAYLRPWIKHYPPDVIRLINAYGITETTVHCTYWPIEAADILAPAGSSCIGRPLPETKLYLCNPALALQPIGVPGEIYVGGSGVGQGYRNRPELTAARFIDSPFVPGERLYRSGDLACWRADGTLEYLGRNDDQVQLRGFRVELGEIEAVVNNHAAVEKSIVLARGVEANMRLVCYVVPSASAMLGEELLSKELRRQIGEHLPEYMIPSAFVYLSHFPLTANGKIDRRNLPDPAASEKPFIAARDDLERIVCEIWGEVLQVEVLGIHDNFFELGGHSLKAAQIVTRMQQTLKSKFSLSDLFRSSTVAELVETIRSLESTPGQIDKIAKAVLRLRGMSEEEKQRYIRLKSG